MSKTTKHPADFSTEGLCKEILLYRELQSKSSFDEMYLSMMESEVERRRQFPFNAREIEQYLPS
jgi:hypothetical protein